MCKVFALKLGEYVLSLGMFRPQIGESQVPCSVLFFGTRANKHHGKSISTDVCYVAAVAAGETC